MQGHVQQQRADHPALGSSLLGRGEPAVLDHPRLQPSGDQFPGRERAELAEQVMMVDPVERRRQVRVEYPPPGRVGALADLVDGLDRVMAATAGPEPVGPRLEPGLPLGLQRVDARACSARSAITGIPSGRRFPPAFGMYTRLTGRGLHAARRRAAARRPARPSPSLPARPSRRPRPSCGQR